MINLEPDYHNKLSNGQIDTIINDDFFKDKDLEYLQNVGLNLLGSSLTKLRTFSHSNLSEINPVLHRTITFKILDELENIPNHLHNARDLSFYLVGFFRFTLNLEKLLKEEKLIGEYHDRSIIPLLDLIHFRKDIIGF
ncbi:hypothetical protein EKG37_17405 [Robertmurraya yapensis]|uniref:Uncharacterized protein n=1 Tax=Bacillus yapensis TaxID=2492960 RepID=A0A431VXY2_9BACI|nr:hypothetical protein [Bacillus yapensis]RTR28080.1 hypothetical protein EKG37_17405 [Bacillus yapensis]TKS94322.1 hypothetical protein FAR12_17405 [Bacillus yapensis]